MQPVVARYHNDQPASSSRGNILMAYFEAEHAGARGFQAVAGQGRMAIARSHFVRPLKVAGYSAAGFGILPGTVSILRHFSRTM